MVAQIDREYKDHHLGRVIPRLLSYALFEGRPKTTKGQWINALVFFHFNLEKILPQLSAVNSPVYIIGTGRSGTTILGVILSVHSEIGFLNEPKAMWHSIFSVEDVIGNYTNIPGMYRLGESHATSSVVKNAHKLYGAYAFVSRQKRVVDKYPEMIFRVPFVRKIFPDAKFIFLTRDGWDTCASISSWSVRNGVETSFGETHDWWGVDNRKWNLMKEQLIKTDESLKKIWDLVDHLHDHQVMAAVEWIVTMREGLRQASKYPEDIMLLRYEDFVESPRASLKSIFEFCKLAHDEACISYAEKILEPIRPYPHFDMPAEIKDLFEETRDSIGY